MSRTEAETPWAGELRRKVPKDTLALTIEGSYFQALGRRGPHVRWWARVPLPEGALRAGHVVDQNQIARCTLQLLRGTDNHRMRTVLALPTSQATWHTYTLSATMTKRHLEDAMLREQHRLFPNTDTDCAINGVIGGGREQPWQVYSAAVPRASLYNFVRGVIDARLKPEGVDLRALALFRAAGPPTCVCVDAGRNSIEVGVFQNGIPLVIRPKYLSPDEMDPNYYRNVLDDEVQRALVPSTELAFQGEFPPQAPVVLSGEMALRPDMSLREFLKETTGRLVIPPDPGVSLPAGFPVEAAAAGIGASLWS